MSELKPCMCCESNDIEIITYEEEYHTRKIAECMDCGARGCVCDSKEEAIEAWNTRPAEDALTAEVKKLSELNSEMEKILRRQCALCQLRDHELLCELCDIEKILNKIKKEQEKK